MHNRTEFIRVHKAKTNTSIIINIADIEYITVGDGVEKVSKIVLHDPRVAPFPVNETPDKIYKMLGMREAYKN